MSPFAPTIGRRFAASLAFSALVALFVVTAPPAQAQVSKGHQILIDRGLQLQGLAQDDCYLTLSKYTNLNYTSVSWINEVGGDGQPTHSSRPDWIGPAPGFPWSRWTKAENQMPPQITPYGGDEAPYMSQLIALQLGDEWNLNDDTVRNRLVDWFTDVRNNWPNTILYHNSWGSQIGDAQLADFYGRAQPDMLCFDTYPWRSIWDGNQPDHIGAPISGQPTGFYGDLRRYREHARGAGIPFGIYRQTFHAVQDYDNTVFRDPSFSELRLNTFSALAFNAKFITDFLYNTGAGSLFTKTFNGSGDTVISTNGLYYEMIDVNKRAQNLGKALVRLTPILNERVAGYTTTMMLIRGKDGNGTYTPVPVGFRLNGSDAHTDWVYQANDPYLRSWSVTNTGSKNNGQPGDVIVAWFKPLDESFDGPDYTNQIYMMVVNGLTDPTGTAAACSQEINLNFDNAFRGLEMVNPLTGNCEAQLMPLANGRRQLTLNLDGGDAALFKFPTGAPFVGVPVTAGPAVVTRDPATRTNLIGTMATFNVLASGAPPLAYQWMLNGQQIPGATGSSYTNYSVQLEDAGSYTVLVSNASGNMLSDPGTLSVQGITLQPESQTVAAGANVLFRVAAVASPAPSYQWRFNGTNIAGATASTYTRLNVQSADAGNYSVTAANAVLTFASANALLTVQGPPTILEQPKNEGSLPGGTASFSVSAVGTPTLTYQWRKDDVSLTDNGFTFGASTSALTINNVQLSDLGTYTVVVGSSFGSTVSTGATLSVPNAPAIQTQPQSRSNVAGTAATFTVGATGGALRYQWRRAGTNISDGGNISGATTDTLTLNPVGRVDAATYSVVVTNAAGTATSSGATLTVTHPLPWRDPFNYVVGENLAGQVTPNFLPWVDVGTSIAGPSITIEPGNLIVPGMAPSYGNSIRFGAAGKSARLSVPTGAPFNSGTIYYSFALMVSDLTGATAGGGFIAGFNNSTGTQPGEPTVVATRVNVRTAGGGFQIGLAKSTSTIADWVWNSTVFNADETIFIVGSYTFTTVGNATDDVARMWINPDPSTFGGGTVPDATLTAGGGNDISANQVASFVFFRRSANNIPSVMIADDLRIGTTWASVTPIAAQVRIETLSILPDGRFQFQGRGDPGYFMIESSSDLVNWTEIPTSASLNGVFEFSDPTSFEPHRYYRARVSQ